MHVTQAQRNPNRMEILRPNEITVGDLIFGVYEVTIIQMVDHYGKPAFQFTFGQNGRLVLLPNIDIPVKTAD